MKSKIFNFLLVGVVLLMMNVTSAATPTMQWSINTPDTVNQITFGLTINQIAPVDEFYFANQFGFTGGGGIGYISIQPTKITKEGKRQFIVFFSSFREDTNVKHENCRFGADDSAVGVTCQKYIPGELGDTFRFNVVKDGNLITGSVVNETSGQEDIIGQWTVDSSAGSLAKSQSSWIENYEMHNASYKLICDNKSQPCYEVKFLPPTGNNGELKGTISTLSGGLTTCPGAVIWEYDNSGTLIMGDINSN